jgi:hypothetical protein
MAIIMADVKRAFIGSQIGGRAVTVDEILNAEIPGGKYTWGLDNLKREVDDAKYYRKLPDNHEIVIDLCAAFTALHDLATGNKVLVDTDQAVTVEDLTAAHMVGHAKGKDVGRSETISEVRKIVEEMRNITYEASTHKWGSENEAPKYDLDTLYELSYRLDALKGK